MNLKENLDKKKDEITNIKDFLDSFNVNPELKIGIMCLCSLYVFDGISIENNGAFKDALIQLLVKSDSAKNNHIALLN